MASINARSIALGFVLAVVMMLTFGFAIPKEKVLYAEKGVMVKASSGPEELQIVLKKGGKTLKHAVFVYAPAADGFYYLGNGSDARPVPLGRFIAEGEKLLRKLGYQPGKAVRAELGVLIFAQVMNVTESNGKKQLEVYTDIIAVPLSPEAIRGKRVVVEKEFVPVYKHEEPIGESSSYGFAQPLPSPQAQTTQCGPELGKPKQVDYCYFGSAYSYCYYWLLRGEQYLARIRAPIQGVYFDNTEGQLIRTVILKSLILLDRNYATSLDITFGIQLPTKMLSVGVGFSLILSSGQSTSYLLNFACSTYNSRHDSSLGKCTDNIRNVQYFIGNFYDDAVVFIGIDGEMRVGIWDYIKVTWYPTSCTVQVLSTANGLVYYPYLDGSYNNALYPALIIDDKPFSTRETKSIYALAQLRGWVPLPQQAGTDFQLFTDVVVKQSGSLEIPFTSLPIANIANEAGGLSLSIDLPVSVRLRGSSNIFYLYAGDYYVIATRSVTWRPGVLRTGDITAYIDPSNPMTQTGRFVVQIVRPGPR